MQGTVGLLLLNAIRASIRPPIEVFNGHNSANRSAELRLPHGRAIQRPAEVFTRVETRVYTCEEAIVTR